jgi:large subunit ribosomal protein L15
MSEKAADKPAADDKAPKRATAAKGAGAKKTPAKSAGAEAGAAKPAKAAKTTEAAKAGKATAARAGAKSTGRTRAARSTSTASTASATGEKTPAGAGQATGGRGRVLRPHHLRPAPGAHKSKIRKGRGEASKGKTAGRGTKGTKARDTVKPGFEGGQMPLIRRLPKLKGFSNPFRQEYQVVNLDRLALLYPQGGEVNPDDLAAKGAVRAGRPVKILGTGDISSPVRVKAHAFSSSAKEKINAAGGATEQI